jgi:hypothetical protein
MIEHAAEMVLFLPGLGQSYLGGFGADFGGGGNV